MTCTESAVNSLFERILQSQHIKVLFCSIVERFLLHLATFGYYLQDTKVWITLPTAGHNLPGLLAAIGQYACPSNFSMLHQDHNSPESAKACENYEILTTMIRVMMILLGPLIKVTLCTLYIWEKELKMYCFVMLHLSHFILNIFFLKLFTK